MGRRQQASRKRRTTGKAQADRGLARFLGKTWWQGVGGIACVVAIILPILIFGYHLLFKKTVPSPKGPPVAIAAVNLERDEGVQGLSFVFPKRLSINSSELNYINSSLGSLGNSPHYYSWARANGGVDPNVTLIQLILRGNRKFPVRILNMHAVGHCTSPLSGTYFEWGTAGADFSTRIGFNLDKADPAAQQWEMYNTFGGSYFESYTVSLKEGEEHVFQIAGMAKYHYCAFKIQLTVLTNNGITTETVDNKGRPFEVSGTLPWRDYRELYGGGVASGVCFGKEFNEFEMAVPKVVCPNGRPIG